MEFDSEDLERIRHENEIRIAAKSLFRANAQGEQLLKELGRFCRVHSSSLELCPDGKFDPLRIAALEGRREVYLHLVALINSDELIV